MPDASASPAEGARERADRRFAEALEETGLPDPRDRYREWLRELRGTDEGAFRQALEYYDRQLVPSVAREGSDPFREWTEYGLKLARRLKPGAAVRIDRSGRSHPGDAEAPQDDLVLHLPTSTRESALSVRVPARLSPAQEATYALLVERRVG